jgi:CDP-2,3-bis-(O-geranylgeranyl)-sn-glycerol synthase
MLSGKILLLLIIANGAPIVVCKLLGTRYDRPIDGGKTLQDGRRVLGPSKTWRGLFAAVLAGAIGGWALGLGVTAGLAVGGLAMAGDLLSSFMKRRLGFASSGMALGLDQIPESLFPLLGLSAEWQLGFGDIVWLVAAFVVLELAISRLLYWLHIRQQPY